jgi:hypothetical protein
VLDGLKIGLEVCGAVVVNKIDIVSGFEHFYENKYVFVMNFFHNVHLSDYFLLKNWVLAKILDLYHLYHNFLG